MSAMTEFEDQLFSERIQSALYDFGPEVVLPMIQVWDQVAPQREPLRLLEPDETLDAADDRMHWEPNGIDFGWSWDEEPYLIELECIEAAYAVEMNEAQANKESKLTQQAARHDRERRAMDLPLDVPRFEDLDLSGLSSQTTRLLQDSRAWPDEKVVIDHYPKLKPPPEEMKT